MQPEQSFERDFCPHCMERMIGTFLACIQCGREDLIPTPAGFTKPALNEFTEEEIAEIQQEEADLLKNFRQHGTIPKEGFWGGNTPSNISVDDIEEIPAIVKPVSKLELDEEALDAILNKPFGFLTGLAGTGKTTLINEINRLYPHRLEVCATTGIAAVNLNSKTIHSTLKFFDLKSMENAWREQLLHMNGRKVRARKQVLLVDESSMLGGEQLDFVMNMVDDINSDDTGKQLGVWLSGDLCQLPPVKMKYVFHSNYWNRFAENTITLKKVWRQDNLRFMEGINLVRANKNMEAMEVFKSCGVTFLDKVNDQFEGTTLIPNNDDVDSYNEKRLRDVKGTVIRTASKIKGKELPEWVKQIPYELRVKKGAYVMILANDTPNFSFVNGDCGWIEDYDSLSDTFLVKLKRTDQIVRISRIIRENFSEKEPEPHFFTPTFSPYNSIMTGDWVIGTVSYHPIRLAYASTIHKSQGLSLDVVQINTNPQFFGYDSMGYVSISRARTPEGLYLVGKPENIGRKMKMNKEVMKYV